MHLTLKKEKNCCDRFDLALCSYPSVKCKIGRVFSNLCLNWLRWDNFHSVSCCYISRHNWSKNVKMTKKRFSRKSCSIWGPFVFKFRGFMDPFPPKSALPSKIWDLNNRKNCGTIPLIWTLMMMMPVLCWASFALAADMMRVHESSLLWQSRCKFQIALQISNSAANFK